ncbi:hypothetical protein OHR68_19805 [Spirillospora sp. NBC_00431]
MTRSVRENGFDFDHVSGEPPPAEHVHAWFKNVPGSCDHYTGSVYRTPDRRIFFDWHFHGNRDLG